MPNYHVVKNRNSGNWDVKKAGNRGRVSGNFNTQSNAERAAKGFASRAGGGEVRIHSLDGKIRDSDTVAPCPPRDRRH